jgi:hypothetical protein
MKLEQPVWFVAIGVQILRTMKVLIFMANAVDTRQPKSETGKLYLSERATVK